jgi:N-acetylmuramoyl-L-alanine amidase
MRTFLWLCCISGLIHAVQVKKIYVHQAPTLQTLQDTPQLELTKAVLCFSEQPIMHQLEHAHSENNGWKHEVYFFSVEGLAAAAKKNLPDMQKKTDYYQLACTQVTDPKNGLRVEICYDPQYIMCVRESFDAITTDKGVVFRLINKKLLDDMRRADKPLLQIACNRAHRVVIDNGHGGYDAGAIANAAVEKDITLQVGHRLARLLREKGCEVFFTRDADVFVPLALRTNSINRYQPDAYISIHANSAPRPSVQGIETYCLSPKLFVDEGSVDASHRFFKEVLAQRYTASNRLAELVQDHLISGLSSYGVCDRKVRHSVTQILLGTNFPGILVEVGFVTHPEEALRLTSAAYQEKLTCALCDGLIAFLQA